MSNLTVVLVYSTPGHAWHVMEEGEKATTSVNPNAHSQVKPEGNLRETKA